MNDNIKRAIKILNDEKDSVNWFGNTDILDLAIEALEKQIPKRAKETQELAEIEYICSICGRVNHSRAKYCWSCGQAIDQ